jgi:hypothetical protein
VLKIQVYVHLMEERTFQFFHCILDLRHIHILLVSRPDDMADRDLKNYWNDFEEKLHLRGVNSGAENWIILCKWTKG